MGLQQLVYCMTSTYPSDKAHCVQISKMCDAFVGQGLEVTLCHPQYFRQTYLKDPFQVFNIQREFKINPLLAFNFLNLPLPRRLMVLLLNIQNLSLCAFHLLFLNRRVFLVSRELLLCGFARILGFKNVVWEVHMHYPYFFKSLLKMPHRIVSISKQMQQDLKNIVPTAQILYLEDGYAPSDFDDLQVKSGLSVSPKLKIGYFGKAYTLGIDKGLSAFLESLVDLKQWYFPVIVGIENERMPVLKDILQPFGSDYILTGHKPFKEALDLMKSCDVLILPYPRNIHLEKYTSPLKLFEYMACGKIILCSNLPTLTGIIKNGMNGLVYEAGNSADLKKALKKIVLEHEQLKFLGHNAIQDVKEFSYDNRARKILESFRK